MQTVGNIFLMIGIKWEHKWYDQILQMLLHTISFVYKTQYISNDDRNFCDRNEMNENNENGYYTAQNILILLS